MGVRVVEVVEVVHHAFNGYGTHLSLPDEDLLGKSHIPCRSTPDLP